MRRDRTGVTMTAASQDIALFPLGSVLFPGGLLPLRIFETRYIDLVRKSMRDDTGFGIVLILDGAEAGPVAGVCSVGTYGRIVDFSRQPDGLLGIVVQGQRRFRILERYKARDGLNRAQIEWLDEAPEVALPIGFAELAPALDQVLERAGEPYAAMPRRLDDAGWVAARLTEILPLPPAHKQHCLELDDPLERLSFLRPLFEITSEPTA